MPIDHGASRLPDYIVYDSGPGTWSRISARLWRAPNGDVVSVESMTLELRFRLGANELANGTDQVAASHLRDLIDP